MATNPLAKIIGWLRAGYPEGVPQSDYVALFGILHRSLTPTEVEQVVAQLRQGEGGLDGTVPEKVVRRAIRQMVHQEASPEDIERVMHRIDAARAELADDRAAEG